MNEKVAEIPKHVLDGLDGCGKGTLTYEIANKLVEEYNQVVLLIEFPQYHSYWGEILHRALRNSELELTMEERMALFAINRLEAVDSILQFVKECPTNSALVFDRFWTSNIITAAYFLAQNELSESKISLEKLAIAVRNDLEAKEEVANLGIDVSVILDFMLKVDSSFIQMLGLADVNVFVPQINPRISMERVISDNTRDDQDIYENHRVQIIADWLYQKASVIQPGLFTISLQEGRSPEQITDEYMKEYVSKISDANSTGSLEILRLTLQDTVSEKIQAEIEKMLDEFPALRELAST